MVSSDVKRGGVNNRTIDEKGNFNNKYRLVQKPS